MRRRFLLVLYCTFAACGSRLVDVWRFASIRRPMATVTTRRWSWILRR